MAVIVKCADPGRLLRRIYRAIEDGYVETWSVDDDGDFTHSPPQWLNRAWLSPRVLTASLTLNILNPRGVAMTREVYAIYHGRFIEMLLAHFDEHFERATATALPTSTDIVR